MTIREKLAGMADAKYRDFSAHLLPPGERVLGVRLPDLRKLAHSIAAGENWRAFLKAGEDETFEEVMLQGMVIGYAGCSVEERFRLIRDFVPRIRNWSVCDSFCSGLKFARTCLEEVWDFLAPYFRSDREFDVRFACVMLLCYYPDEEWLERDLAVLGKLRNEPYYAMMAAAWALSILYLRHPEKMTASGHSENNLSGTGVISRERAGRHSRSIRPDTCPPYFRGRLPYVFRSSGQLPGWYLSSAALFRTADIKRPRRRKRGASAAGA